MGVISSQEFEAAAGEVRNRILIGGILVLAVFAGVAVVAAGKITRPIKNICAFMQKVEKGDLFTGPRNGKYRDRTAFAAIKPHDRKLGPITRRDVSGADL